MARKLPIPNGRLDGALDANSMRIVNLMEPMSGDDAATKKYVDGKMAKDGLSAYEVAVKNGFSGTEADWLKCLKGEDGASGLSAYEIAVRGGFSGTIEQWLESLNGKDGKDADEQQIEIFKRYVVARPLADGQTYQLEDCAMNVVDLPTSGEFTFVFPPRTGERVRDFVLKLNVTADPLPTVRFVKHATDDSPPRFEGEDGWSDLELGVNFFGFTESS